MRALRAVVCCRPEGEIFLGRFLSPPSPTYEILSSPKPTHNPMGLGNPWVWVGWVRNSRLWFALSNIERGDLCDV
jgi:hypothetical protein